MDYQSLRGNQSVQIQNVRESSIEVSYGGDTRELPLEPAHVPVPSQAKSPARLVRARSGVVPYVAREDLLGELQAWMSSAEPFAGKVIGGRGGSGKTRLGVELCQRLQDQDWLCGFLSQIADPAALEALVGTPAARLVVIDYAESRLEQLERLLPLLAARATAETPVRTLLLVRASPQRTTDWAERLRNRTDSLDSVLDECEVCALEKIPLETAERAALFGAASTAFAARIGPDAAVPEPPTLDSEVFASPLLVVIAAYLSVHGNPTPPTSRSELLEEILGHEQRYWRASWPESFDDDVLPRRLIAMATLTSANDEADAAELLQLLPDLADATAERRNSLARWCRRQYPGPRWWSALEPDLLGEHLVAEAFSEQPGTLAGVLRRPDPKSLIRPLEVFARAATDHPSLAAALESVLSTELDRLCALAIEEATKETNHELLYGNAVTIAATLDRLVNVVRLDDQTLLAALASMPNETNLILNSLVASLASQLAESRRRISTDGSKDPQMATVLNLLAIALYEVGQSEQALAASEESASIYRHLASVDSAYRPGLASALGNYAVTLSGLGHYEDSLSASEEVLDLYRQLAEDNSDAFEPALANSLSNLSVRLSENDRHEDSLAAVREATDLRRRLAAADKRFEPDLARSLNNLSISLGRLERRDEALTASEEAVEVRRRLARENPASHEPFLASALHNLSINLARGERPDDARTASEEAVAICRKLVAVSSAAYEPKLASYLRNHSERLEETDSVATSLPPLEESVEISRRLAVVNPNVHAVVLARSLLLLSQRLDGAGRSAEAEAIREELEG